jgi:hypothetical protein
MSLNFLAETTDLLDWRHVHSELYSPKCLIEFIPMPGGGINGGDAIGISIPSKNICEKALNQLKEKIRKLTLEFKIEVLDLYSGEKIDAANLEGLKTYFE